MPLTYLINMDASTIMCNNWSQSLNKISRIDWNLTKNEPSMFIIILHTKPSVSGRYVASLHQTGLNCTYATQQLVTLARAMR
jgi:hypothetical protein